MKGKSLKKDKQDELRKEYHREELGKGNRGKHLKAYRAGTNLVLLKPELAAVFPTEQAVNDALSSLIEVARQSTVQKKASRRRPNSSRR